MTPSARVAAAIGLIDRWTETGERAEPMLRAWSRANRYAGGGDRRAIADLFYDGLRRLRSLAWASGAEGGRAVLHGLALAQGCDADAIFNGAQHAPSRLEPAERAPRRGPPPDPVRFDHPDWLEGPLKAALGDRYAACLDALRRRAPVDLRVNRLRGDRAEAQASLAADGVETEALALADALRAAPGAPVSRTSAWAEGLIETQDAASQEGAAFAAPAPGETVLDFCAGGGGKALAFASLMRGEGRIVAYDATPARMRDLPQRAARAGARIELADRTGLAAFRGACDLVFVDAPCSGSGTWRRDPEAKWRLTPDRLRALMRMQRQAAEEAEAFVAPGGRLVFATCSLLVEETGAASAEIAAALGLAVSEEMRRLPDEGADGFYAALLRR